MKRSLLTIGLLGCLALGGAADALRATASFYHPTGRAPYCRGKVAHLPPFATWRSVALSPDLLRRYPCGSRLRVTFVHPLYGKRSFTATVQDRTSPRISRRVDVLVSRGENALAYGLRGVTLRRLR